MVLGGFTTLGVFFIGIFMKETKGKTQAEIENLFYVRRRATIAEINKQLISDDFK